MILVTVSLMLTFAASTDAVVQLKADKNDRASFEAWFVPLPSSESKFAALGPVGPFFPQGALKQNAGSISVTSGGAVLECVAKAEGVLERCRVVSETPTGFNFGLAAKVLADRRRIFVTGAPPGGEAIGVHVRFDPKMPVTVSP